MRRQLVSQCATYVAATHLRDMMQEKLPNVTPPLFREYHDGRTIIRWLWFPHSHKAVALIRMKRDYRRNTIGFLEYKQSQKTEELQISFKAL